MESEEQVLIVDLDTSQLSDIRMKHIIKRIQDYVWHGGYIDKYIYKIMVSRFSEEYSSELLPGEIIGYETIDKGGMETMVDLSGHMAKEFSDTETITPKNVTDKDYEITRIEEVTVNQGPRAGSKAVLIELDNKFTYWPNKTSITTLVKKFGTESEKWKGQKIRIGVEKMMVRNERKEVLFAEPSRK